MKEKHPNSEDKPEPEVSDEAQAPEAPAHTNKLKRLWHWVTTHKKLSIPAAVIISLAVLAGVPHTRYGLAGMVVKQTYPLTVLDSETSKPVSGAKVSLDDAEAITDNQGRASLRLGVGFAKLEVSKKYYNAFDREVVVPFRKPGKPLEVKLKAIGRPVPITVVHKISKKPLANVTITAEDTDAKTDKDGKATLVLPADKKDVKVKFSADGLNAAEATLTITTAEVPANTFELTPTGRLYFLSNQSGKIDVIKTNLDGTDRQTVLAGTGREDKYNTVLLASRDWKYLALHAKRDSDLPKLYLINTSDDSLTVMDEGKATFSLSGWSGHHFIYSVTRDAIPENEPKRQALKSYKAETKKITTLDETRTEKEPYTTSYFAESLGDIYAFEDEVIFLKNFNSRSLNFPTTVKGATVNTVHLDGSNKKEIVTFSPKFASDYYANAGIISYLYEGEEIYLKASTDPLIYEFHDGKLETLKDFTEARFFEEQSTYPTYLLSPSGQKTFWSEQRDGKNIISIGDKEGKNPQQVATLRNYQTYGWYTDDILLLSKENSELYAMPTDGIKDEKNLIKITDYYKPAQTYRGYGGGYGGL